MSVGIPPQRWRDDFLKWVAGYRFDRHNDPSPRAVVALGLIWSHYASNDGTDSYPGYRWLRSITSLRPDEITRVREFLIVHGWLADDGHGPHGSNRVLLTNVSEGRQSSPAEPSSEVQQSSPADRSEGREHPASEVRQSSPAEGRSEGRSEGRQSSPEPPTSDRKGGGGGEPHDTTATPSVGGNTTTKEEEDDGDRLAAWSNADLDEFIVGCGLKVTGDTRRKFARRMLAAGYTLEHAAQLADKFAAARVPEGAAINFAADPDPADDWLPSTVTPTVSYRGDDTTTAAVVDVGNPLEAWEQTYLADAPDWARISLDGFGGVFGDEDKWTAETERILSRLPDTARRWIDRQGFNNFPSQEWMLACAVDAWKFMCDSYPPSGWDAELDPLAEALAVWTPAENTSRATLASWLFVLVGQAVAERWPTVNANAIRSLAAHYLEEQHQ